MDKNGREASTGADKKKKMELAWTQTKVTLRSTEKDGDQRTLTEETWSQKW